jgi:formylglycine-generating enzyme required for sulfatase activity
VSGGTLYRGYDVATDGSYPDMSHPATVSDFRLDRYEVTVGRFRQFVTAGMGTQAMPPSAGTGAHPSIANSGWDASWNGSFAPDTAALEGALVCDSDANWTASPGANENRPINCVTWFEAMAFCVWDGGYLPTELEWHYAASGGSEQRAYPWSSPPGDLTLDCTHSNYQPATGACVPAGTNNVGLTSPAGDGAWGQADLSGNVDEWALDWYGLYANPCNDCANLFTAAQRVYRGGDFLDAASYLRAAFRNFQTPAVRFGYLGMRCARLP